MKCKHFFIFFEKLKKYLTLDSRIIIKTKLNEGESFKAIGRFLNKDCTTISKEVKHHISFEKSGAHSKSFTDCRLAFQRNSIKTSKNGEVLIVTLRQKPNRFEQNAWLGLFYYFMQFCCIYTLKCAFQSVGRFIAVRLTTPILF